MVRSAHRSWRSSTPLATAALLGALAGGIGCATPPRTMTFREAGLQDAEPAQGPDGPRTPTARAAASRPSAARTPAGWPHANQPLEAEQLPLRPPVRDAAPEAFPSQPPEGPPIDPILLRFAAEARSRRLRSAAAHGFPPEAEAAWRALLERLDEYLVQPLPQTPLLELVRSSVTLEAEWDFDQRRYGAPPPELARLVAARAGRLSIRIATSRAIGQTMFAARPPGRLRWPIENAGLSSGFGLRDHPLNGTRQLHAGIDLAADLGRVVSVASAGYVVSAGWAGGYGILVEVRHPGNMTTRYGHLSALLCATGDALEAGAPIGLIGQTGLATGPHLHFEVWEDGQPRDPLAFIGGGTGLASPATVSVHPGGAR